MDEENEPEEEGSRTRVWTGPSGRWPYGVARLLMASRPGSNDPFPARHSTSKNGRVFPLEFRLGWIFSCRRARLKSPQQLLEGAGGKVLARLPSHEVRDLSIENCPR